MSTLPKMQPQQQQHHQGSSHSASQFNQGLYQQSAAEPALQYSPQDAQLLAAQQQFAQQQQAQAAAFAQQQAAFAAQQQQQAALAAAAAAAPRQVKVSASPAAPTASKSAAAPVYEIPSYDNFHWITGGDDKPVNESRPLLRGLAGRGLSSAENVNVSAVYLQELVNDSDVPLGLQLHGVNGKPLQHHHLGDGSWATYVMTPNSKINLRSVHSPRGLLIAQRELDRAGITNTGIVGADLLKGVEKFTDERGKQRYRIPIDMAPFTRWSGANDDAALGELSPLQRIVLVNARAAFVNLKHQGTGQWIPVMSPAQGEECLLPSIRVAPNALIGSPTYFEIGAPVDELDQVIADFRNDNLAKAQPTIPGDLTVRLIQLTPNGAPQAARFGDLGGVRGSVSGNRSKYSAAHVLLDFDVQHNGKVAEATSQVLATKSVSKK